MKKKNNVTIWIICGVILVVLIAVIVVLIVNGTNSNKKENTVPENNTVIEEPVVKVTEQDIIEAYGMSKKDAEEIALANFNSDNYECVTTTTENYTYKVEVTDIIDDTKYYFEVDPQTKTAFLIEK